MTYTSSIQQTLDGGLIFNGDTKSIDKKGQDAWLLKLDSNGNVKWQKAYDGTETSIVYPTADGGYLVGGSNYIKDYGSANNTYIMKLDGNGNVLWQKIYLMHSWNEMFLTQALDGGYIISSGKTSFNVNSSGISILKLDSNGNLSGAACNLDVQSNITARNTNAVIKVNPTINVRATQASTSTFSYNVSEGDATVITQCTSEVPILSVAPTNQNVTKDAGGTTFNVTNAGVGTMYWSAAVTSGSDWLYVPPGTSGTNSGTINCSYLANTTTSSRTATIQITASSGTNGSPVDVTVTQAPSSAQSCTATINEKLSLHIPVLSYLIPYWGAPSYWADFVYEYNPSNPTMVLFKLTNAEVISNPTFTCTISTISNDMKIHIPDLLLPDGITHLWVDLEYNAAFSTAGNAYFVVTGYGSVSN